MVTVRKAYPEDFNRVYSLLCDFNNPYLNKDDWGKLFFYNWAAEEDYRGYMLIDKSQVVGFLGYIFSKRSINGKEYPFCNLSSWIVKKGYRNQSLLLLFPALRLKDYTVTNLTPTIEVFTILKSFGFKELESKIQILFPIPRLTHFHINKECSIVLNDQMRKDYLNKEELKIYSDHLPFDCIHLCATSKAGNCYIIITRTMRKKLPFARIHYISNIDVFYEYFDKIKLYICIKLKTIALIVDQRFIDRNKIYYSIEYRIRMPGLYKSAVLDRKNINNLYSELFLIKASR